MSLLSCFLTSAWLQQSDSESIKYCVYSGLATFLERVIHRIHPYYQDISYLQQSAHRVLSAHKKFPSSWDSEARLTPEVRHITVKNFENKQAVLI